MKSPQALREQIAARATEVKSLVEDHKGAWTAAEEEKYSAGMKEIESLKAELGRIEAVQNMIQEEVQNAIIDEAGGKAAKDKKSPALALYAKFLRGGDTALTSEEWATVRATMSTTTNTEGGYTVPTEIASQLIDSLKAFGGMREVSSIIQTAGGNPLTFPTSDGTSEVGEIVAENTAATAADPTFGTVGLPPYKFSSKVVAVPYELLQDSAIDIESFIRNRIATRVFRITNAKFTVGSGTGEPSGVMVRASAGKVGATGQTTTITYDDLIDLVHSIDPAYRALNNCRFMLNDASLKIIRKLKDTTGRPIFIPGYDGLGGKMPDTILGYPVQINQDVATMAANAKSIGFGDFSFYTIRDVMAAQLFRFTDSAYTKLGQVGFLQWSRHGGNLLDVNAVKYYQNSAT